MAKRWEDLINLPRHHGVTGQGTLNRHNVVPVHWRQNKEPSLVKSSAYFDLNRHHKQLNEPQVTTAIGTDTNAYTQLTVLTSQIDTNVTCSHID